MLSLLLAVPSCIYSFWHGVSPSFLMIFILVSLIFYPGLALTVAHGEMPYVLLYVRSIIITHATHIYSVHVRACVLCARIKRKL